MSPASDDVLITRPYTVPSRFAISRQRSQACRVIAKWPLQWTRMTLSMPNHAMFDQPESGFDAMHPAWPAELVVFLASEHVDFNGQGFIVWGGQVVLVQGWHTARQITKDGGAITAEELVARRDELFGDAPREPGYL